MSTKPQPYMWTATGMRHCNTTGGVTRYMNEFDVRRYVDALEAKIKRLKQQVEMKEAARLLWKQKAERGRG